MWIKLLLTLLGAVFLGAISLMDPANFITLTGAAAAVYDDGAKAASFALVAAMMIAVHRMPVGDRPESKLTDLVSWIVMAAAGFMAAWSWLKDETGNPWPYLEEILVVGGVLILAVVVPMLAGAGIGWSRDKQPNRNKTIKERQMATPMEDSEMEAILLRNGDVYAAHEHTYLLGTVRAAGHEYSDNPLQVEIDLSEMGEPTVPIRESQGWKVRVLPGQGKEPVHGRSSGIELRIPPQHNEDRENT